MKVTRHSLTYIASRGLLTTQVPTAIIGPTKVLIDVPDEFFYILKFCGVGRLRVCFGREREWGILHLSRIGFEVYKDELAVEYVTWVSSHGPRSNSPTTKADYIDAIRKFYDDVDINTAKEAMKRGIV